MAREALVFYAPLPDDLGDWRATLRFPFFRRGRDLRTIAAAGILSGLVALAVPVLLGQILAEFIPRSDTAAWTSALLALLGIALGSTVFGLVQGFAILRVEGRVDERLQAAIWSRLLALPAPFFRQFTAGDLADRANGISRVRQYLTGASLQAALSGIFLVFSAALLFYYSRGTCALRVRDAGGGGDFGWERSHSPSCAGTARRSPCAAPSTGWCSR